MSQTTSRFTAAHDSASTPPASHAAHPLRALFRKTFAELIYVVIGAWAIAAIWAVATWYTLTNGFTKQLVLRGMLMDPWATGAAATGCAALGFLLGVLQFRPIRQFETWALLVHRPMSRSRLFFYCSRAGLALYGITVALPLAIFLEGTIPAAAAVSGFYWSFLGPYVASVVTGAALYFAGALITLRQARWFATRFVPFAGAILIFALALVLRRLTDVLIADALATAAFGLAAWGAFFSQGRMRDIPRPARAALLASLAAGCMLFAFIITALGDGLLTTDAADRYPYPQIDTRTNFTTTNPVVLSDGRIALWTRTFKQTNGLTTSTSSEYFSRDHQPIPNASRTEPAYVSMFTAYGDNSNYGQAFANYNYRSEDAIRALPSAAPYPLAPVTPNGMTLSADESLVNVGTFYRRIDQADPAPLKWDIVLTTKHLYLFDHEKQKTIATFPLPTDRAPESVSIELDADLHLAVIRYAKPAQDHRLARWINQHSSWRIAAVVYCTYDLRGQPIDSAEFAVNPPFFSPYESATPAEADYYAALARFAGYQGILHAAGMSLTSLPLDRWTTLKLPESYTDYAPTAAFHAELTLNLLSVLALAALARWYRLRPLPAIAWLLAALILGPLTLLIFVSFHTLPPRVTCTNCHKRRPVGQPLCPHCRAPFPAPAANGTEILADSVAILPQPSLQALPKT